jgi:hypothetical protein
MTAAVHSQIKEGNLQVTNTSGLLAFLKTRGSVQRHVIAKFRSGQFDEIGMIVGDI